jgi:hypothetical protein
MAIHLIATYSLLGVVDFNAFDSLQGNHSDELLVLGDPA